MLCDKKVYKHLKLISVCKKHLVTLNNFRVEDNPNSKSLSRLVNERNIIALKDILKEDRQMNIFQICEYLKKAE